jgi:hypothetical protein
MGKRLLAFGLTVLVTGNAWAFKTKTHVAAANETLDQLARVITSDPGPNTLTFQVNGQLLTVNVTAKQAYQVILRQPEFFRAGAVGPDGFLDPISGQMWAHGNESELLADIVQEITGTRPADHATEEPFGARARLAEFRSIDFVTAMLRFAASSYPFPGGTTEREQVQAFILGYLSHGIGDGFSHTWVNELAEGAWDIGEGRGIFGSATEEVKHIAVERFLDTLVPNDLVNTAGDTSLQRLTIQAPIAFLDAFFSAPVTALPAGNPDSSPEAFATFFGQVDTFHGGPVSSLFNAQIRLAQSAKGWSQIGPVFDFAERFQETDLVSTLLDAADYPAQLLADFQASIPAVDPFSAVSGGVINCYDPIGGGVAGDGSTTLETLRDIWRYVGTMNERLAVYEEKARVVRRNWPRLAECTIQNVTNLDCFEREQTTPPAIRDACTVVAERPFQEDGDPRGISRGTLAPGDSADVGEFLAKVQDAFRGGTTNAFEDRRDHFGIGANMERMLDYLAGAGLVVDEFAHVIVPRGTDGDGINILDRYRQFCAQVRDEAFENCLDLKLAPIAAVGRKLVCEKEHLECVTREVGQCLGQICRDTCGSPFPCGDMCGSGGQSACANQCEEGLCEPVTIGICPLCETVTLCIDTLPPGVSPIVQSCTFFCRLFTDEEDHCTALATDATKCGVQNLICDFENIKDTIELDNFGEEILTPFRDACDTVDQALAFVDSCFESPDAFENCVCNFITPAQCTQLRRVRQRARQILNVLNQVQNEVCEHAPHTFVNVAFLWEDMLADPLYLDTIDAALPAAFAAVNAMPPGPDRDRRMAALIDFQDLVNDARAFRAGNPIPLLTDPDNPTTVVATAYQLGLIPEFAGPTAQAIISEVGADMRNTFDPFFNTVQGTKLAPMTSQADLETLFLTEGADPARLPWMSGLHSAECSTVAVGPYCDAIASFDDPNCLNCDAQDLTPDPSRFDWIPGRGIVAWNPYDPTGQTPKNVLTSFSLATSQPAYDQLYRKVFRTPAAVPGFAGFDDPRQPWQVGAGDAGLTQNPNANEGGASLQVDGCGFVRLDSPNFMTADWGVISNQIAFDIFIPTSHPDDYAGAASMSVTVRGANLNLVYLGQHQLTPLPQGVWNTLVYAIPQNVYNVLAGDFANAEFHIGLTFGSCDSPFLLDNLRFVGDVIEREVFHVRPSTTYTVATNSFMSFDDPSLWVSTVPLLREVGTRVQGAASTALVPGSWTTVTSRPFSVSALTNVTNRINLDVFLPNNPPVPDIWQSTAQLFVTCGRLNNQRIGDVASLRRGFLGEWNSLEFAVSSQIQQVLSGARGNFDNCSFQVALSVTNPNNAVFYLDNMGFIQP